MTWHGKEARLISDMHEFDPVRIISPPEKGVEHQSVARDWKPWETGLFHYLRGFVDMLDARESGCEEAEDDLMDDLDDRWKEMTEAEVDVVRAVSRLISKKAPPHRKRAERQSEDVPPVLPEDRDWSTLPVVTLGDIEQSAKEYGDAIQPGPRETTECKSVAEVWVNVSDGNPNKGEAYTSKEEALSSKPPDENRATYGPFRVHSNKVRATSWDDDATYESHPCPTIGVVRLHLQTAMQIDPGMKPDAMKHVRMARAAADSLVASECNPPRPAALDSEVLERARSCLVSYSNMLLGNAGRMGAKEIERAKQTIRDLNEAMASAQTTECSKRIAYTDDYGELASSLEEVAEKLRELDKIHRSADDAEAMSTLMGVANELVHDGKGDLAEHIWTALDSIRAVRNMGCRSVDGNLRGMIKLLDGMEDGDISLEFGVAEIRREVAAALRDTDCGSVSEGGD